MLSWNERYPSIESLKGKTITAITSNDDGVKFTTDDGFQYSLHHEQDCCESVWLEEIHGDLLDLVGHPLQIAEERSEGNPNAPESGTWTFFAFATVMGHVTIRFCGESNGYYSETASLYRLA